MLAVKDKLKETAELSASASAVMKRKKKISLMH